MASTAGVLAMAAVDFVKWDAFPDQIVWKFPRQDLSTWTQLVVNESQEAWVVHGGVYDGPFGAGRHTLTTENIPLIRNILGIPFGGQSPFTAEVWFVNKVSNLAVKWGTPDPIQLMDPANGVLLPVRAFGQYGVQIVDGKRFLLKLLGTGSYAGVDFLAKYLNGELIKIIKQGIANAITVGRVAVFEASTKLIEISDGTKRDLDAAVAEYGIGIPQFNIHSINVPEDDPSVIELKNNLSQANKMRLLGTNYQQMMTFDVLKTAAGNEGAGGALIGAGMGLGVGAGIGSAMGGLAGGLGAAAAPTPPPAPAAPAMDPAQKLQLLKELAELKSAGILTDEEFASEKKKILG